MVNIKNKKGVSVIIGYVILITMGIILAGMTFSYLKSYTISESIQCPSGASFYIKEMTCQQDQLILNLMNNGRFNLFGYFIHGSDNQTEGVLATIDLSKEFAPNFSDGVSINSTVYFSKDANTPLGPNGESINVFNLTSNISAFEITPVRFQDDYGVDIPVSCGQIKLRETITCPDYCPCTAIPSWDSGELCLEIGYDVSTQLSDYIVKKEGYSSFYQGPSLINYCGPSPPDPLAGDYVFHDVGDPGIFTIQSPDLPYSGEYEVTLTNKRGQPYGDPDLQHFESFEIVCGGELFEFPDIYISPEEWRNESFFCDLNVGHNNLTLTATGNNSVHFEAIRFQKQEVDCSCTPVSYSLTPTCIAEGYDAADGEYGLSDYVVDLEYWAKHIPSLLECESVGAYYFYNRTGIGAGIVTLNTTWLPYTGKYNFTITNNRGSEDQDSEFFEIHCGGDIHYIPDDVAPPEGWVDTTVLCNFNKGYNEVKFVGTAEHGNSIELVKFSIDGIKTCSQYCS